MKSKRFFIIFAIEVVIVAAVTLYFFVDSADIYKLIAGNTKFYEPKNACDLHHEACSVEVEGRGTITFEIAPKDIPLMQELTFTVTTSQNLALNVLDLSIYATNMNMGYNTFKMKKVSDKTYEAKGILPTCIVGNMKWNAEVVFNEPTQSLGALFKFKTK